MRPILGGKWGAVAALAISLSAAAPAAAEPAMWIVSDEDTTVHLFGTIHLLAPQTEWRTDELDAAMAGADALWLEIDILRDTSGALAMITRGTSPKLPLKDRLGAEDFAKVERAAGEIGVPMNQLDRLRPWLAAVTLSMEAIRKSGFDLTGVDIQLAEEAMERGLPVRAFETGAEQVDLFASLDEAAEVAFLMQAVEMTDVELQLFRQLYDAWSAGDVSGLNDLLVQSIVLADPALADALLTDRNVRWAERFDEIMAEPGQRLVAVGAGHLVGDNALPDLLRANGYAVEMVE